MLSGVSFKEDIENEEKKAYIAMDKDADGFNVITPEYLRELCANAGQFENPKLNDCLFLHYKGFRKIGALEKYVNLKAIWLECNGILTLSGLEQQLNLRSMYVHQNQIKIIENINHLKNLVTLNLSSNLIKKVEGLKGLDKLKNLDLAGNLIPNTEACEELVDLPELASLDLKNNQIDDHDNYLTFFARMPNLRALYLRGNPATRNVGQIRRNMTLILPNLTYLEDRPIWDYERLFADAWKKGGKEAENIARDEYKASKARKIGDFQAWGKKNDEEGIAKRKFVMKKMMDELRGKRDGMIDQRAELKEKYQSMSDYDQMKPATLLKMRQIDQELKTEFYKILEEKGEEKPNIATTAKDIPQMIDKQYQEKSEINEARMKYVQGNYKDRQEEFKKEMDREREEQLEKRAADAKGSDYESDEDEESESEFQKKLQGDRIKAQFKWTPKNEGQLEEILIDNQFDFKATTQEFMKVINKEDKEIYYEVDEKTVQLRWTDIEIRKYRMSNPKGSQYIVDDVEDDKKDLGKNENVVEEDTSRIGQLMKNKTASSGTSNMIKEVEDIKDYQRQSNSSTTREQESMMTTDSLEEESSQPVNSNIIDYADGSSSEDEVRALKSSKVQVTHYNDLEELD